MKRRVIVAGSVAVAVAALIWLGYLWAGWRARNDYIGTVETREIQVGSKVGGRVTEVPVEEGQMVKTGAVLVRFECDELKAQKAQAEAALAQAQADLDRMERGNRPEEIEQAEATAKATQAEYELAQNGPRKQEIDQAKADYAAANADAANAEVYYKRMEKLVASDTISKQQFDDARDRNNAAAERAESARQRLALLEAGTRARRRERRGGESTSRHRRQRCWRGRGIAGRTLKRRAGAWPRRGGTWPNWMPA